MNKNLQRMEDYYFKSKSEAHVVKVPNCTFANDFKEISTFYFCMCKNDDEFFPICEACATTCHKAHSPSLKIKGIYVCKCGVCNHEITQENESLFKQRSNDQESKCIYSKFMEITPSKGYYSKNTKTYCAICAQFCLNKDRDRDKDLYKDNLIEEEIDNCEYKSPLVPITGSHSCFCQNHFEINYVNLNLELNSKPMFHLLFQNFNYNILTKFPKTEEKFIKYLVTEIKKYTDNEGHDSKEFFSNFFIFKTLEMFSLFAQKWENKFFHIKNYFIGLNTNDIVKLMSLREDQSQINEAIRGDFFISKFYFSELVFNYLIRSYLLKYNNIWNVRTILNMNLYQRMLYYASVKEFFLFHTKESNVYPNRTINAMITHILELYDNILKFIESDENSSLKTSLFSYIFPAFTRIFKYMIKANLINQEQSTKYFELVFDSIKLFYDSIKVTTEGVAQLQPSSRDPTHIMEKSDEYENDVQPEEEIKDKSDDDINIVIEDVDDENTKIKSAFYIMKSILYTLIHYNDQICIKYMQSNIDPENKNFVFMKNPNTEKICKVFMAVINTFSRKENLSRTKQYDLFAMKILELLISSNDFYLKSINNAKYIPDHEIKLLTSQTYFTDVFQYIHKPYLDYFTSFDYKMNDFNRQYLDYSLNYEAYLSKTTEILLELKEFIIKEIEELPDISLRYLNYASYPNEQIEKNATALQNAVKYSIFFQKMEEYIHIYSEGKMFAVVNEEVIQKINMKAQNDIMSFILKLYYILLNKNSENLCLVMNIKPQIFVEAFIDIDYSLFDFLERVSENMFYSQYEFDNYDFFSESLCIIIRRIADYYNKAKRTEEKDILHLQYLGYVFKLTSKVICKTNIKVTDFVDIIDAIQSFIQSVSSGTQYDSIQKTLADYFDDPQSHPHLKNIIMNYLFYLSELINNDFLFFNSSYFHTFLFDLNKVLSNVEEIVEKQILPIEIEYGLINLYLNLNINFGFSINHIDNQFMRLFRSNANKQGSSISNVSLPNLAILKDIATKEELESELRDRISVLKTYALFLYKINQMFQKRFDSFFKNPIGFASSFEVKLFFYKCFENILIRHTHTLFNMFTLYGSMVNGADCTIYQLLVFELLKNVSYFFNKTNQKPNNIFDRSVEAYYTLLSKKSELFLCENISLMKELTYADLQEIVNDLNILQSTKYYHLEVIYSILNKTIQNIFYMKPKLLSSIKTQTMRTKRTVKIFHHIERINKLSAKYQNKKKKTYDANLSLFSALIASEKEIDIEIGRELLLYLLYKLPDQLTEHNYSDFTTYHRGRLNEIHIRLFLLQNSYVLIFLNDLFYNYSEKFQKYLSNCLGKLFPQLFEFLSKDIVFSCSLNEVTKMYTLDRISNFNQVTGEKNMTLSSELCNLSIKLLQNMCESHNRLFQNRFFRFFFDVNNYSYVPISITTKIDTIKHDKTFSKQLGLKRGKTSYTKLQFQKLGMKDKPVPDVFSKSYSRVEQSNRGSAFMRSIRSSDGELEKMVNTQEVFYLDNAQSSFFNFIIHQMRMLCENLHFANTPLSKLLCKTQELKSTEYLHDIYHHLSDLVIEMIQGTQPENFDHFYKTLTNHHQLFLENDQINKNILPSFVFLQQCFDMQNILFKQSSLFDVQTLPMKNSMFTIIINVISQEMDDTALIPVLLMLFPPDQVLKTVSRYLRAVMIRHIEAIEYDDPSFEPFYNSFELGMKNYGILKDYFKSHIEIFEDDFFKLAGNMYLFLTILGKKYHILEVERLLHYDEKEIVGEGNEDEGKSMLYSRISGAAKDIMSSNNIANIADIGNIGNILMKNKNLLEKSNRPVLEFNNYIITAKFFNKIIKSCEFMIENDNKMNIKTIYFLTDPRVYHISKNNLDKFKDEVDRSTSTNKLKCLIDNLDAFLYEVEFTYNTMKKTKYLKWMFSIDYRNADFFNFCSSLAINFMLLLLLDRNKVMTHFIFILTVGMAGFQILFNLIYIFIFLFSKYEFYVILAKSKYPDEKHITYLDYPYIYLIDSFLLNEEVNMMLLIVLLAVLGMTSEYACFLYTIQLLSVIKFVSTIKEIVLAFQIRIGQLLSMIGFLGIFIFVCASLSFHFFNYEFMIELPFGEGNICSNLFECWVTYFNLGVRSGGGIGDILQENRFNTGIYWVRWFNDMIFFIVVILMLMNMINGVIVSTFSQIREESSAKEEDINNKCFICNIDRVTFERFKINFEEHLKNVHNIKTYIRFLICLKMMNEKDLDADQSFILDAIRNREIKCFPVNHTASIGEVNEDDEDDDETEG